MSTSQHPAAKAFLDTTILVDVLLKPGEKRTAAKSALGRFVETEIPRYAIKEFGIGAFSYFMYLHNVLSESRSFSKALDRIQKLSRTPQKNRTSTSMEALSNLTKLLSQTPAQLAAKYGPGIEMDKIVADELRLELKAILYKAWAKKQSVATRIVYPLSCYSDGVVTERRGLLELVPKECSLEPNCCLAREFRSRIVDVESLEKASENLGKPGMPNKQRKALRHLRRTSRPLDRASCRALGDAVFAFLCPTDAVILTTNLKDHQPLAQALGKQAETP